MIMHYLLKYFFPPKYESCCDLSEIYTMHFQKHERKKSLRWKYFILLYVLNKLLYIDVFFLPYTDILSQPIPSYIPKSTMENDVAENFDLINFETPPVHGMY